MEGDCYEYTVLMEGIQYALEEVRASNFYCNLVEQIQEKPDIIFSNLSPNIGSTNVMPMVIYGLGSIQCSYAAIFQLAYVLLLRDVAELKIDREITICCDDISSNPIEEKAMKAHGCKVVLMTDGRFRWTADDDPTLFFLPFTRPEVLGDLLEVNWCPSRLERMIILGRSLESMAKTLDEMVSTSDIGPKMTVKKLTYVMDRLRYVWGIREHTTEFEIGDTSSVDKSQGYNLEEMFQDMYWHVFDFAGVKDMDILLPSMENCFKWVDCSTSYPYRMDEEDVKELPRLQHEMEVTIMDLRESEYYLKLRNDLKGDQLLKSEISRRIGSEEHVQMVIYGLGSLEYSFQPQFQLALALLLREEVDILRIGDIQVFDPKITPVDANVIRSFGCTVLSVNESARRRVENPTIIFLPFAWYNQVANLLEVKWSSSQLKNLIILGVSMHNWNGTYDEPYYEMFHIDETEKLTANERCRYMLTIKDWSVDFAIDGHNKWPAFRNFRWVFFNLQPNVDINSCLPSFPTLDKIRVDHEDAKPSGDWIRKLRDRMQRFYLQQFAPNQKWKNNFYGENVLRAPSRYLKTWSVPQPGWIKLNFDGYGNESYGYGGILCNDDGEILLSYAGPMPSANNPNHDNRKGTIAAQVEGLRQGVRCFKQLLSLPYDDPKLIIEGSALSVVRWANSVAPPLDTFEEAFKEMCVMLEETNCLVYHIYPEANAKACELAKLGIKLSQFNSWR